MEGIIIFLLLAILAVPIVLLIWVKTSTSSLIHDVLNKLNYLNAKVDQLDKKEESIEVVEEEDNVDINESLFSLMDNMPEEKEEIIEEVIIPEFIEIEEEEIQEPETVIPEQPEINMKSKQAAFTKPKKAKRNIEQFIGENLINKLGIGILVLGIAFFVNYAIDNNWIGQVGRLAIGFLTGGILVVIADRIRKTYKAFSSVLLGGAMAVFYFTISIGFHEYHKFSQPVAFTLMAIVTAFSVLLSISYDKKTLAILALIGAFSTPIMLSNGEGDYVVLFTYIAIVNVGMLVLAYFKKWNLVNILSFTFTVLLYSAWYVEKIVGVVTPPYKGALIFASLFYLIFFLMHIINNVKEKRKFKGYEFGLMLGTTALYYGAGMVTLHLSGHDNWRGLFTIALGVFNLLFAYPLFKGSNVDKSLIYLLVGMVLTFISLAAPVQLSGNYITLFWSSEMVLLLWLGQKSGIKFIKLSSLVILGLMLVSLIMDWQQIYLSFHQYTLTIILNKGFVTTAFSIIGMAAYYKLLNSEKETDFLKGIPVMLIQNSTKIITASLIYFIGFFELAYQVGHRLSYSPLTSLVIIAYSYAYLLALSNYAKKRNHKTLILSTSIASAVAVITYPLFNHLIQIVRADYLFGDAYFSWFAIQYLVLALITVIGIQLFSQIRKDYGLRSDIGKISVWGFALIGLVVASSQLSHHTLLLYFNEQTNNMSFILKQTVKIGYPIIWGIASFIMMMFGMKYKYRTLRIISLSIFSLLLFKLFLFDIKGASEAGKIIAFILLGVLLLVISFMYQKLKNLFVDDSIAHK